MKEKNVLIFGGSRFIGYLTLIELVKKNWNITIFNRQLSVPPAPFPKNVRFIKGDRNNPNDYIKVFNKKYDLVIDFSGFKLSQVEPIFSRYSSNIKQYIFISTVDVYKKPYPEILYERSLKNSLEKSLIEDYILQFKSKNQVTILRLQGVFGPYDPCIPGLLLYRIQNDLPIFLKANSSIKSKLLYIYDFIKVINLLINNANTYGKIYNISGDEIITLDSLISYCSKISNKEAVIKNYTEDMSKFIIKYNPKKRHVDISPVWPENNYVSSNLLIKEDTKIQFTNIENSLEKTFLWLNEKSDRLKYFSFPGENYILSCVNPPYYKVCFWKIINFLDIRDKIKTKINKYKTFKLRK